MKINYMYKIEVFSKFFYSINVSRCFMMCPFYSNEHTHYLLSQKSAKLNTFLENFKIDSDF